MGRRQGRWEEAIETFNRALVIDPRNVVTMQQLSVCYQALNRIRDKALLLDRALAISPNDVTLEAARAFTDLEWHADPKPMQRLVDRVLRQDPAAAAAMADRWLFVALCARDAASAGRALDLLGSEGCHADQLPFARGWCEGLVAQVHHDDAAARVAFADARRETAQLAAEQPESAETLSALALADAMLGHRDEAIGGGRRAVEMLPDSKDAVDGPVMRENLALIYGLLGERDLAIAELTEALSHPSYISYGYLRLHPLWDPLRGDPRFEQIVASLAPKD
jgi:tetratricopeptide (TPR) repeat protein